MRGILIRVILSHKHKFIFFKTKKTASTSLEIVLSKLCGQKDIITPVSEITWTGQIRRFEKNNEEDLRKKISALNPQNFKGSFLFEIFFLIKQFFHFYFKKFMISLLSSTKNKVFKAKRRFKYDQHMEIIELKKYVNNKIFKNYLKFAVVRNPYDQAISDYYDQSFRPEHIKYKNFDDYLDKRVNYFFYKNKRKFTINDKIMLDDVIKYETLEKDLKRILKKLKIKDKSVINDLKKIKAHGGLRKGKVTKNRLNKNQKKKIKKAANFFLNNFYHKVR